MSIELLPYFSFPFKNFFPQETRGAQRRRIVLLCVLCGAILRPFSIIAASETEDLLAIGDIHGDVKTFRALLRRTGLIDAAGKWSGGKRILVQTGDILDRGAGSRAAMELLQRLESEAAAAGGRVTVLLGNHEVMNLVGDLRYVTPGEFRAYAKDEDSAVRAKRQAKVLALVRGGSPLLRSGFFRYLSRSLDEQSFGRFCPPGFFGHRAAFAPGGRFGKWLFPKDFVHVERRTIFVHGGLGPGYQTIAAKALNDTLRAAVGEYLAAVAELERLGAWDTTLGHDLLLTMVNLELKSGGPAPELRGTFEKLLAILDGAAFEEGGPLWYRGLAQEYEPAIEAGVTELLRFHQADRIVIGHTQSNYLAIEARLGGKVILIDTGMNQEVYAGHPAALVITPDGGWRTVE